MKLDCGLPQSCGFPLIALCVIGIKFGGFWKLWAIMFGNINAPMCGHINAPTSLPLFCHIKKKLHKSRPINLECNMIIPSSLVTYIDIDKTLLCCTDFDRRNISDLLKLTNDISTNNSFNINYQEKNQYKVYTLTCSLDTTAFVEVKLFFLTASLFFLTAFSTIPCFRLHGGLPFQVTVFGSSMFVLCLEGITPSPNE